MNSHFASAPAWQRLRSIAVNDFFKFVKEERNGFTHHRRWPSKLHGESDRVYGPDVARELGIVPVAVPGGPVQAAARALSAIPTPSFVPPTAEWVEAISHPAIMDPGKAKRDLGWQPRYTSLEALRDTLG